MGKFKEKPRSCKRCKANWIAHEEKESDVNIAIRMLMGAVDDEYDQAFLVTGDSDLAEPCRMIRNRFPKKQIKLLAPPGRPHSKELWGLVNKRGAITEHHLERSLFDAQVLNNIGLVSAIRPAEYNPPA